MTSRWCVLLAAGAALLAATCGSGAVSPEDVQGPFAFGGVENVTRVRHLWFSGQPDAAALERAKAEGIAVVIDLREPSEHEWNEGAAVEALGMTYYNVPVRKREPFERDAFERIEALVERHHDERVWLHCSTGNRVGGWFATHLAGAHGMPVEDALAVARRTGVTKREIEENVRGYLRPGGG